MKFSFKKHLHHTGVHGSNHQSFMDRWGSDPKVDWAFILVLSVLIGAGVVYAATLLFFRIQSSSFDAPVSINASSETIISPADISKLVESYSKRHSDSDAIRKLPYTGSPDPSK